MTSFSPSTPKKVFNRNFTLMVLGQIISLFGNAILRFALSMAVLDMTGSAAAFATISAVSMLPTILLSPLGGMLADRASRKWIMAALDYATTALLILFAFIFHASSTVMVVGVMMILLSVIQSFYQPAVQASIPTLVDSEGLMTANGVVVQVSALANLLGPILGGFFYGIFGLQPVLTISAVCFFGSAVMECFLRIPFERRQRAGGALKTMTADFKEALRFLVKENPEMLHLLLLIAGINFFYSAMLGVGLPYLVKLFLGLSNQMYGFAQGAMGVGSIAGGLLAGVLAKKLKFENSHIFLAIAGGLALPLGLAVVSNRAPLTSFGIILVTVGVMMCSTALFNVYAQTIAQKLTPPLLLGKVSSVITVISMCAIPLGQALYGVLFDGAREYAFLVVFFGGAATVVLALLCRKALKKILIN